MLIKIKVNNISFFGKFYNLFEIKGKDIVKMQ